MTPVADSPQRRSFLPYVTALAGAVAVALVWLVVAFTDEPGASVRPPDPTEIPASLLEPADGEQMYVLHPATRCAWPQLPNPWQDWNPEWDREELLNPVGQAIVISDDWIVPLVGGQIDEEEIPYEGADTLKRTAKELSDSLVDNYYVDADGSAMNGLSATEPSYWKHGFAGHEGIVLQRKLTWDEPRAGETEETQIVAVVDVDGDRAVAVVAAISGSQMDQYLSALQTVLGITFLE